MTSNEKEISDDIDTSNTGDDFANSIEAVRKCNKQHTVNTSWEQSYYASIQKSAEEINKTPPFVSIMVTDIPDIGRANSSTQTELFAVQNCGIVDVSLSFSKDFMQDSSSNENSEHSLGNKRYRRESSEIDNRDLRPSKKTKCTESCSSSTSDLTEPRSLWPSVSTTHLSSTSETSFKSINSNHSYKVRKRRRKSDSNLIRDVLQRSRKASNFSYNYSENNTTGRFHLGGCYTNIFILI